MKIRSASIVQYAISLQQLKDVVSEQRGYKPAFEYPNTREAVNRISLKLKQLREKFNAFNALFDENDALESDKIHAINDSKRTFHTRRIELQLDARRSEPLMSPSHGSTTSFFSSTSGNLNASSAVIQQLDDDEHNRIAEIEKEFSDRQEQIEKKINEQVENFTLTDLYLDFIKLIEPMSDKIQTTAQTAETRNYTPVKLKLSSVLDSVLQANRSITLDLERNIERQDIRINDLKFKNRELKSHNEKQRVIISENQENLNQAQHELTKLSDQVMSLRGALVSAKEESDTKLKQAQEEYFQKLSEIQNQNNDQFQKQFRQMEEMQQSFMNMTRAFNDRSMMNATVSEKPQQKTSKYSDKQIVDSYKRYFLNALRKHLTGHLSIVSEIASYAILSNKSNIDPSRKLYSADLQEFTLEDEILIEMIKTKYMPRVLPKVVDGEYQFLDKASLISIMGELKGLDNQTSIFRKMLNNCEKALKLPESFNFSNLGYQSKIDILDRTSKVIEFGVAVDFGNESKKLAKACLDLKRQIEQEEAARKVESAPSTLRA